MSPFYVELFISVRNHENYSIDKYSITLLTCACYVSIFIEKMSYYITQTESQ